MLRTIRIVLCWLLVVPQAIAAPPQYAFRITFRDKAGAPALTATPPWLSARSLSRRAAFGISLDSTDRPVSPLYVDSVLTISGGKFHNASRWLNQVVVLLTDTSHVATIRAKPWVRNAEWVGFFATGLHKEAGQTGQNPKSEAVLSLSTYATGKLAGSSAYYGLSYGQTDMVHGDTLHDQGLRGKGKLIAVLDQGFTDADTHRGFDSLRKRSGILETYNFVLDTSFVYGFDSHGLGCFSTMAGLIPGSFVGTAPDAQYALYITEDGAFTDALYELDNLVAGMERADSLGADIITASLGYNIFTSPFSTSFTKSELDGTSTLVTRAANMAVAKGIFYATSAGNEGNNSWNYLVSPADADSVLTIGAVNPGRLPANFSSPGPNAAGRVKPDICMQGDPAAILVSGGGVGTSGGTSFAAPQAAGYAACLMQAFPTLPPAIIRETFARISHLYPSSTPKLGYGIPDFRLAQAYLRSFIPDTTILSFRVSPNPFLNTIMIELPKVSSVIEVAMVDMLGRSVGLQEERAGAVLRVTPNTALAKGIYMLRLVTDGQISSQKLLHL